MPPSGTVRDRSGTIPNIGRVSLIVTRKPPASLDGQLRLRHPRRERRIEGETGLVQVQPVSAHVLAQVLGPPVSAHVLVQVLGPPSNDLLPSRPADRMLLKALTVAGQPLVLKAREDNPAVLRSPAVAAVPVVLE